MCAVSFHYPCSETADGGHCQTECWIICTVTRHFLFQMLCTNTQFLLPRFVLPSFYLFCALQEGKDLLMSRVLCFSDTVEFSGSRLGGKIQVALFLLPASQAARLFPHPDSIYTWLFRLEGLYLKREF